MKDNVVVAFPRSHPFKQADFYPDPTFLAVDGAPMVLFPNAAILIDYTHGKADVTPVARLKADNHADLTYLDFVMMVGKSARDYRPAWFEHMPPPRTHPETWPFDLFDFPRGAKFLKVDGTPMVLKPDGTLISYRGGKAHPVSDRIVSSGKYVPISYDQFEPAVKWECSLDPSWDHAANPHPYFPTAWPFNESDFPAGSRFLEVNDAPMAWLPDGALVSFFGGNSEILSIGELSGSKQRTLTFTEFSAAVHLSRPSEARASGIAFEKAKAADEPSAYQCSKTGDILVLGKGRAYFQDADSGFDIRMLREGEEEKLGLRYFDKPGTSWSRITDRDTAEYFFSITLRDLWRKPPEPELHLDHWLNKLALAMLKRWSRQELPNLMPVFELALVAVPEGMEDGPEGQAFEKARRLAPSTVLGLLEEAFQPEDLLDATNLQDAAQMILNEIEGFGEITDSQLYREREGRE